MTDATPELKKTKDRSPSFPYITLERALERARAFYNQEKRGVVPYTRAVLHWNMSEASSGALQTVSALKAYGLLSEPGGSGKARQLQLTDLALRILLDQRPDSPERQQYIREACRTPSLAAEVYDMWPGLPSDSTLSHFLVLERRFNEATAPAVMKILKENQAFAKLYEGDVPSSPMEIAEQPVSAPTPRVTAPTARSAAGAMLEAHFGPTKALGHTEQLASIDGEVTVSLHFSGKPDSDFWEWISEYASRKAQKLKAAPPKTGASAKADNPSHGDESTPT